MLNKTLTALALAAVTALPLAGVAQAQNAGEVQLARSVGVQPGVYSLSQLTALASYEAEGTSAARAQIDFILANPHGTAGQPASRASFAPSQSVLPQDFGTDNPNRLND